MTHFMASSNLVSLGFEWSLWQEKQPRPRGGLTYWQGKFVLAILEKGH